MLGQIPAGLESNFRDFGNRAGYFLLKNFADRSHR